MQKKVGQGVPVGLRKLGNQRVNSVLDVHFVVEVSDAHESVPQRERDEGLLQRAEELLQSAGDDVNVNLSDLRLALAAQQPLLKSNQMPSGTALTGDTHCMHITLRSLISFSDPLTR